MREEMLMSYERRLLWAKSVVTILLFAIMVLCWGGLQAPTDSAGRAIFWFAGIVMCVGTILLWHPLHGTGRSVRITGVLATGVLATQFLTLGASLLTLAVFWCVVIAVMASVNRKAAAPA